MLLIMLMVVHSAHNDMTVSQPCLIPHRHNESTANVDVTDVQNPRHPLQLEKHQNTHMDTNIFI